MPFNEGLCRECEHRENDSFFKGAGIINEAINMPSNWMGFFFLDSGLSDGSGRFQAVRSGGGEVEGRRGGQASRRSKGSCGPLTVSPTVDS